MTAKMTIEERIRARAYSLWEAAGGVHGNHEQHWHQAALELAAAGAPARRQAAKPAAKAKADKPVARKKAA